MEIGRLKEWLFGKKPLVMENIPKHTPIFGVCIECGTTLLYSPIKIPRLPVPKKDNPYIWTVIEDNYCIRCAVLELRSLSPEDLIPSKCWMHQAIVENPVRRKDG